MDKDTWLKKPRIDKEQYFKEIFEKLVTIIRENKVKVKQRVAVDHQTQKKLEKTVTNIFEWEKEQRS